MIYDSAVSSKEKRRFEISGFKGVDLSSSKTKIATNRASEMFNIIDRNGLNRKRFGFKSETNFKKLYGSKKGIRSYFHSSLDGRDFKFIHLNEELLLSYNNSDYCSILSQDLKLEQNGDGTYVAKQTPRITISDKKGKMYESNGRLYFVLGGSYLCFKRVDAGTTIKYVLEDVFESEETYIPLVLTNINSTNETADKREALDDYNKLTRFVRYGLVGETVPSNGFLEYKIGKTIHPDGFKIVLNKSNGNIATIKCSNSVTSSTIGTTRKFVSKGDVFASDSNVLVSSNGTIMNVGNFENGLMKTSPISILECSSGDNVYKIEILFEALEATDQMNVLCKGLIRENINGTPLDDTQFGTFTLSGLFSKKVTIPTGTIKTFNMPQDYSVTSLKSQMSFYGTCYKYESGYNLYFEDDASSTIGTITPDGTLSFNSNAGELKPAIDGNTNIYVYNKEVSEDVFNKGKAFITECVDSTLFGTNGSNDRIFFAYKNTLFWTEFMNNSYYEYPFTYISDMAYATIGANNCDIKALQKLNDSTLGVFKEEETNDSNFYAVAASSVSMEEFIINGTTYAVPAVKVVSSSANLPEILASKDSLNVLGEDILFASKNGIYAVKITGSINPQRTASERAKNINAVFNQYDLTTAKSIVWDNKYFLALNRKDGTPIVFIADSRYKYRESNNFDGSYNFEWYVWDSLDVQEWFIEDGNLGFFSKNAEKYVYQNDDDQEELKFVDYYLVEQSSVTDSSTEPIAINGNWIQFLKQRDQYFFKIRGTNVTATIAGETLDIKDKVLYYKETDNSFEVSTDNKIWFPYESINVSTDAKAYLFKYSNVKALYVTGVFNLGASDMVKTLFGITMSVDHRTSGDVIVGYKTKYDNDVEIGSVTSTAEEMDLSAFGFNDVSFGNSFASSYSAKMKIRAFTYIQFLFASNEPKDFAVNELVVSYKYNRNNKGVY